MVTVTREAREAVVGQCDKQTGCRKISATDACESDANARQKQACKNHLCVGTTRLDHSCWQVQAGL